jgi:PEP-CTERM motif
MAQFDALYERGENMTLGRISQRVAIAAFVGWAMAVVGERGRAGTIVEAPSTVGTLLVTNAATPTPTETLTLGGAILINSFDGRGTAQYADSIFKFVLPTLAPGDVITSATFAFTVETAQQVIDAPSLDVAGFGSNSSSVTIPEFFGSTTPVGSTGTIPSNPPAVTPYSFDVTSLVLSLVGGSSDVGLLTSVPGISNVSIYGDDSSNPVSVRPTLTITFSAVPEPASWVLAGLGLLGAIGFKRMRRANGC